MMKNICVHNLKKYFKVHCRDDASIITAFKSVFKRKYKTVKAVDDISFSVNKGSVHGLIGPNGSGKSTTIKMLTGILYPTEGEVQVAGYIPWKDRRKYVKHIGVLMGQKSQLNWEIPALDTYRVHKEIYKIPTKTYKSTLNYLVDEFQINDIVTRPVRKLSLGERMKCELVCILLHMPKIIFLDEPTIGLDMIAKNIFRTFIKKINKEKDITVILTTHDLNEVENLCDRVTVINEGRIVFNDRFDKLKMHFANNKTIELTFSIPVSRDLIRKFNIEMQGELFGRMNMDFSHSDAKNGIINIMDQLPVKDISIHSYSIESIIRMICQGERIPN